MKPVEVPTLLAPGVEAPQYTTAGAAGADIRAHIEKSVTLGPSQTAIIPTGLRLAIPEGFEIQIRPRSGLAAKHQIGVLNSPGTIDADYRGEVMVILINHGHEPFIVEPGMRIAQMVLAPVVQAHFVPHEDLIGTARGVGGLGSTGTR